MVHSKILFIICFILTLKWFKELILIVLPKHMLTPKKHYRLIEFRKKYLIYYPISFNIGTFFQNS